MKVQVRFRFNKQTGEVEEFLVDDVDSRLPEAEHNQEHDRIAAEVGRIVERYPHIQEILPGSEAPARESQENEMQEGDENTPLKSPSERQKQ